MDVAPIKTRRDYRTALKHIEGLMRAKRGTPEGDRLDVLVALVEAWERQWAKQQDDKPSHSEAIRRLIEIALTAKQNGKVAAAKSR